jgi:hypothetical protein
MRNSQPARAPGPQVTAARRAIVRILDPDYWIPYPRRPCDARHKVARPDSSAGRTAGSRAADRPKALDATKAALAQRMHTNGEPASTIAETFGVSRQNSYRFRRVVPAPDRHGHNRTGGKTQDNGLPERRPQQCQPVLVLSCAATALVDCALRHRRSVSRGFPVICR